MKHYVDNAIRAWVRPQDWSPKRKRRKEIGWRSSRFADRALVWDTETTTDFTQRLLFGFYRIYARGKLQHEKIIVADDLSPSQSEIVEQWARLVGLPVISRTRFVEEVFYPEIYGVGTLCVGFNLPFDLSRIALRAILGQGRNQHMFTLQLTDRVRWPRLRVESISPRAAFIGFTPKKYPAYWEKPLFGGRFMDLSTHVTAWTGEKHTLRSAGIRFAAEVIKSKVDALGEITPETLAYGRTDVEATWSLYQRIMDEYLRHPFATLESERRQAKNSSAPTKIFSAASVAKGYLRQLGFRPLLEKQPRFSPKLLGRAAAAYFGGRAEVRVRKIHVPVTVLDYTSNYAAVFILQNLQRLLSARYVRIKIATQRVKELLESITLDDLFDPRIWPYLFALVEVRPNGEVLPARVRFDSDDPWMIALGKVHTEGTRWYMLADLVVAKLSGFSVPETVYAMDFVPAGSDRLSATRLRGQVDLDPTGQVFKTVVEERQKAKRATKDTDIAKLNAALKTFATSGAYGIYFEINVTPSAKPVRGTVYSDESFVCADVGDEEPGAYCNPIIASAVTAGARLLLAMVEAEIVGRGGTFAFCDTDSVAVVMDTGCPSGIPSLSDVAVREIIAKFDRLNPYDPTLVTPFLKREYEKIPNLRCFAVSAKRYVLYTIDHRGRIKIVKASESGLGGIIGRSEKETIPKLARRIWLAILYSELQLQIDATRRRRLQILLDFSKPLRYKVPLTKPHLLKNPGFRRFNRPRPYAQQIKPFGFLQALATDVHIDAEAVRAVAPFERDLKKSRKLPWIDLHTGKPISIDWSNQGFPDAVSVVSMDDFIRRFARHPETKGADVQGNPSSHETRGVLGRLELFLVEPDRIGKEIDRLDEDEGITLDDGQPIVYESGRRRSTLTWAIGFLSSLPNDVVVSRLPISERRWRDIRAGRVKKPRCAKALIRLARELATAPGAERGGAGGYVRRP